VTFRGLSLTGLGGTAEQQLIFLNTHWGRQYDFTAPKRPGERWTAKAKFGTLDDLEAETSAELLEAIRGHYRASKPGG